MLMFDIFYIEFELEMEDVHAEDVMRQMREEQKIQNVECQKAYQGRKSNRMTTKEWEEDLKRKEEQQKEYRKRKLDEMTTKVWEERRKRNADRKKNIEKER